MAFAGVPTHRLRTTVLEPSRGPGGPEAAELESLAEVPACGAGSHLLTIWQSANSKWVWVGSLLLLAVPEPRHGQDAEETCKDQQCRHSEESTELMGNPNGGHRLCP